MIASFSTAGVLTAPPAPLILSGFMPGNTLPSQFLNYFLNHLTLELNNLLILGGVVQNSAVDTQVGTAVQNVALPVARGALAIMNCVRVTTGSALTVPLGSGTVITALGSGSTYTVTLPDAHSALVASFEVDIQNHNAGATNMLGSGYGSVLVNLLNVNDGLAGFTNGTWQITEQYGHLRVRPAISGNPSGFGWVVESCDGTVYRNVVTSTQTQASPVSGTWYNKGGSLALSAGVYEIAYSCVMSVPTGFVVSCTLSTANNSESDLDFSANSPINNGIGLPVYRRNRRILAASGTYFLNIMAVGSPASISFAAGAGAGNIIIEAKRVG